MGCVESAYLPESISGAGGFVSGYTSVYNDYSKFHSVQSALLSLLMQTKIVVFQTTSRCIYNYSLSVAPQVLAVLAVVKSFLWAPLELSMQTCRAKRPHHTEAT